MKAFHEVRSYDSNFMMWHSAYHNISFLAHWHNELELIYAREGVSYITVNDDTYKLEEGGLIICNSGDIHYSDSSSPQNILEFLVFDPGLLDAQYRDVISPCAFFSAEILFEYSVDASILFGKISEELKGKKTYYQEIAVAYLREFWYLLKRKLPSGIPLQSNRGGLMKSFHELLSYLDEHFSESMTLESAAAKLGYSASHFSKMFKKLTGINFVTYLGMIRVEQACTLLKKTDQRAVDIAEFCGFNNLRTFNRTFKEITGYTPMQVKNLPNADSYMLTYYKRRSTEQKLVVGDSSTVINHDKEKNNCE